MSRAAAVAAVLAVAAIAGCGKSGSSGTSVSTQARPATSAASGAARETVEIVSFSYHPAKVVIRSGGVVVFANRDNASHTATDDAGSFDSGTLAQGASRSVTFSRAGTFKYHCDFHPFMHGTVVVD